MKRTYALTVKGNHKTWGLTVEMSPEQAEAWQADGVDLCEVVCTVPEWVNDLHLTKAWAWLQKHGLLPM